MAKVVLAMSGGVDSGVAAWLLREQGHDVVGVFMRHGQDRRTGCKPVPQDGCQPIPQSDCQSVPRDADDAQRTAEALDIPFKAIDFQRDFDRIVDYFVKEYATGRTPNPCIVCNTWLKFGKLFEYADDVGAEYVATGHHARIVRLDDGQFALCRGLDQSKDQSYALFGIKRELLSRLMFPVGEHHKDEIRRIAGRLGLDVAEKRDSQEICFVPDREHARFVREHLGEVDTSGEIVAADGTPLGRHNGIEQFTIGQRKGLRLAFGEPRYVIRIEADTRRVVIGTRDELARSELTAAEANWLVQDCRGLAASAASKTAYQFRAQVKIRYRSRPVEATVEQLPENRFRVSFDEPCFGVSPGQAAVCYHDERVLGGGWIE